MNTVIGHLEIYWNKPWCKWTGVALIAVVLLSVWSIFRDTEREEEEEPSQKLRNIQKTPKHNERADTRKGVEQTQTRASWTTQRPSVARTLPSDSVLDAWERLEPQSNFSHRNKSVCAGKKKQSHLEEKQQWREGKILTLISSLPFFPSHKFSTSERGVNRLSCKQPVIF